MDVYILRLRQECCTNKDDYAIIGVYSTWDKAADEGRRLYQSLSTGLVIWCIDTMTVDAPGKLV